MDMRDFEIQKDGDGDIIISQINPQAEDGKDHIFLSGEQVNFFIAVINKIRGKENLTQNIGYLATVELDGLSDSIDILVNDPDDLIKLHQDIEMRGFGIGCKPETAQRIKYINEE